MKDQIAITKIPKLELGKPYYENWVFCRGCNKRYKGIPDTQKYCNICHTQFRRTPRKKRNAYHARI